MAAEKPREPAATRSAAPGLPGRPTPAELLQLLELAQDIVIVLDGEDRVVYWNSAAERTYGWSREEALGRYAPDLFHPRHPQSRDAALAAVRRDGRWEGDIVHVTRGGRELVLASRWAATTRPDGSLDLVLEANRDVTEERRLRTVEREAAEQLQQQAVELEQQMEEAQSLSEELEQTNEALQDALVESNRVSDALRVSAERATQLLALATALSDATTVEHVAEVILGEAMRAVGADAVALAVVDASGGVGDGIGEFRIIRRTGYGRELGERFQHFPVHSGRPLSDAVLSRAPVLIESLAEWRARYPEMAAQTPELQYEAMANVPVVSREEAIAGISFSFARPRRFDEDTRTFLATVGEQCGIALGRARAFDAERRAKEASAFLSKASRILTASLDYASTLRALATAAVPRLGDWCAVDMLVDPSSHEWPPRVERLAVVHQDPTKVVWAEELARRMPPDWSQSTGLPRVLREGATEFYPVITDETLRAAARSPEELALLREIGFSALIIVPLLARGVILGALTLCATESGRRYDDADRALAEDLAQRAAIAVDNARLYREAERARAAAEEANRAKSDFLATMSHELRTPLNAIGGYAELLEMGLHGPITDAQRTALRRMQRSQRTLLSLINDVLNFARIEAGRLELEIRPTPLADVINGIELLVAPQVQEKGLRYEVIAPPKPLVALVDREKLQQILLNLVANAIKATPSGGKITIGCAARHRAVETDSSASTAGSTDRADSAVVTVADTGVGIPSEKLDRIFEPFVQLDRNLTSGHSGTGLGLAISRDLARQMGGDLVVESAVGLGSTFSVVLPTG